jgi:hypothetical protein
MREGIRAVADLPSNMRAKFIGGKQRLPEPAELLPGLAVDDGERRARTSTRR